MEAPNLVARPWVKAWKPRSGACSTAQPSFSRAEAYCVWPLARADWVSDPSLVDLDSGAPCPVKTTLLVMPANLVPQWQDEIEKHVAPGGEGWCVYARGGNFCVLKFLLPIRCIGACAAATSAVSEALCCAAEAPNHAGRKRGTHRAEQHPCACTVPLTPTNRRPPLLRV
jgi:hypothetical protein